MPKPCTIGFAGTDARTLLSALVVSTASSQTNVDPFRGLVIRGTSSMPHIAGAKVMDWPVAFLPTPDNSVQAYVQAMSRAMQEGTLDYALPLPEALLFQGIIDQMDRLGLGDRIAGLSKDGSFLEADKIACKHFCHQSGIPVADAWETVDARDGRAVTAAVLSFLDRFGGAVLKYPYSAGGKGARVILNTWEINEVYSQLLQDYTQDYKQLFGKKQAWPLLIESRMSGVEISFTIFVDAAGHYQILPTAMDYPERFPGPAGTANPITGGMGSISPHPFESPELLDLVKTSLAEPLIKGMREKGILRPCVVYPGCFVSFQADQANQRLKPSAVRVCEINIRPGEPEFQTVVRRLRNLGPLIQAMFQGNLHRVPPEVREDQIALCLALVTGPGGPDGQKGYPWSVTKHEPVHIDFKALRKKNIQVIPSGMGYSPEKGLYSDGTRVAYLNVNGTVQAGQSKGQTAEKLRNRLLNAIQSGKIRTVPREDPDGNRLAIRDDVGSHFQAAEALFAK